MSPGNAKPRSAAPGPSPAARVFLAGVVVGCAALLAVVSLWSWSGRPSDRSAFAAAAPAAPANPDGARSDSTGGAGGDEGGGASEQGRGNRARRRAWWRKNNQQNAQQQKRITEEEWAQAQQFFAEHSPQRWAVITKLFEKHQGDGQNQKEGRKLERLRQSAYRRYEALKRAEKHNPDLYAIKLRRLRSEDQIFVLAVSLQDENLDDAGRDALRKKLLAAVYENFDAGVAERELQLAHHKSRRDQIVARQAEAIEKAGANPFGGFEDGGGGSPGAGGGMKRGKDNWNKAKNKAGEGRGRRGKAGGGTGPGTGGGGGGAGGDATESRDDAGDSE